jgi:hypothetical protein
MPYGSMRGRISPFGSIPSTWSSQFCNEAHEPAGGLAASRAWCTSARSRGGRMTRTRRRGRDSPPGPFNKDPRGEPTADDPSARIRVSHPGPDRHPGQPPRVEHAGELVPKPRRTTSKTHYERIPQRILQPKPGTMSARALGETRPARHPPRPGFSGWRRWVCVLERRCTAYPGVRCGHRRHRGHR